MGPHQAAEEGTQARPPWAQKHRGHHIHKMLERSHGREVDKGVQHKGQACEDGAKDHLSDIDFLFHFKNSLF